MTPILLQCCVQCDPNLNDSTLTHIPINICLTCLTFPSLVSVVVSVILVFHQIDPNDCFNTEDAPQLGIHQSRSKTTDIYSSCLYIRQYVLCSSVASAKNFEGNVPVVCPNLPSSLCCVAQNFCSSSKYFLSINSLLVPITVDMGAALMVRVGLNHRPHLLYCNLSYGLTLHYCTVSLIIVCWHQCFLLWSVLGWHR